MTSISDPALLINQLPQTQEWPLDPNQLREQLTLVYRRISNTVNSKEGGLFSSQEYFSNQQYSLLDPSTFTNVYRKCFDMVDLNGGPIAPGATVSTPHNITGLTNGTHIYGSATNDQPVPLGGPMRMPLPYATNFVDYSIEIWLDDTNVNLMNGANQYTLTYAVIVAEYLKT